MSSSDENLDRFSSLSEVLTGFTKVELAGTDMLRIYYAKLLAVVGTEIAADLFSHWQALMDAASDRAPAAAAEVLQHPKFGPLGKNIITMWYLGIWKELPQAWANTFGVSAGDRDHVISADAYTEGLAWRSMGTHPMAARQPGFGTWSFPPSTDKDH